MSSPSLHLPPGFRFHPTDDELILHYLRKRASSSPCPASIIAEVDIYKFDPWELPEKAAFGDREWYFFSPRDRKYPNGIRPNRAAASGYWKATGTDKPISFGGENIGVKKALVFYKGRPPKGLKTNWIMHEYRLADANRSNCYKPIRLRDHSMRLDDWVLCRIYKKSNQLSPTMMDQEQEEEDPCEKETFLAGMQSQMMPQSHGMKLQKTSSISEFLEDYSPLLNLLENQQDLARFDNNSLVGHPLLSQPMINQSRENGYFLPQLSQVESPVSIGAKRQRMAADCTTEESSGNLQSLKKQSDLSMLPNFSSQFDGSQYGLLSQPFFSQQLLMNSHIGSSLQ